MGLIWVIVCSGLSALGASILAFIVTKKINEARHDIYTERAKARASALEKESKLMIDLAKSNAEKDILDYKQNCEQEYKDRIKELENKEKWLSEKMQQELKETSDLKNETKKAFTKVNAQIQEAKKVKEVSLQKTADALRILQDYTGFSNTEAKDYILRQVEEQSKLDMAKIIRKYELEATEQARGHANYLLAQATTRFAHEFVNEKLANTIKLESDDLKGRIIGKDGRNIQTLENLLGVDIIIDETPNTILVSSFNLYRRAIASKTLEVLVEDGRVQPARIEETFRRVSEDFENRIYQNGKQIVMDLNIGEMHSELIKLIGKLRYRGSYGQNALEHSLEVATFASTIASELGGDAKLARRAGILHDIGKALTNDKEGSHVDLGAEVCTRYEEDEVVINAIYAHHDLQEAKTLECAAVCTGDVLSAGRPGARRDNVNTFTSRLSNIETIATKREGVLNAYAIDAGRELRVIVNAELTNDVETYALAKEIAKEIEKEVQYPGKVKVTTIRETRGVEYAL